MDKFEHSLTPEEALDGLAKDTLEAMKRAQRNAARENARYGMSLILGKPRKAPAKAKRVKRTVKAATRAF